MKHNSATYTWQYAKNARSISLPSLWQHYLVAMAMCLDKSENKVQIHHLYSKHFHMVKRLQKLVQYIRRYLTKYVSYQRFTDELCQLWSYWTEVHKIFTRHRGIIYTVNAHTEVAISHSISEYQSNISGEFAIFSQNWLPTSLEISEKEVQIDHLHPKRFHSVIDCENQSSRSRDNCSVSDH